METYKTSIEVALIIFPIIALIITFPFLVNEYRKYGAINLLKSTIIYSFFLYLLTAYLMIILPLPSREAVANYKGAFVQLEPFRFIKDISVTVNFNITTIDDLISIFNKSTIYTVLFNIILTMPFGIYLKYLFDKKWYHSILYTFLLSIFFELTQLSGLYGIYPRPYRLFDVDDLMVNTFGGLFGYMISPIFIKFLPTKEKLNSKSIEKSTKVSILRRWVAFTLDLIIILFMNLILSIILYNTKLEGMNLFISLIFVYIVIPIFNNLKTIGKSIVNLEIEVKKEKCKVLKVMIRYFVSAFIIYYPYSWLLLIDDIVDKNIYVYILALIIVIGIVNMICFFIPLSNKHLFIYEIITGTYNKSTIDVEKTLNLKQVDIDKDNNCDE